MTQNTITFEILKEIFEERGQILVATTSAISVTMSASINRLCLKDVNEVMTNVKQILLDAEIVEPEILD